jgi:hypothetical protein
MSEDLVEDAFSEVTENLDKAHQKAVDSLRKKVADAKTEALKRIKP